MSKYQAYLAFWKVETLEELLAKDLSEEEKRIANREVYLPINVEAAEALFSSTEVKELTCASVKYKDPLQGLAKGILASAGKDKASAKMSLLRVFTLACLVRTWTWYGRGIEYASKVFYDQERKVLFCKAEHETFTREVRLSEKEVEGYGIGGKLEEFKRETLDYIKGAIYRSTQYSEKDLTSTPLLIPFTIK